MNYTVHHSGHSSVIMMDNGKCIESRRGSLRNYSIPNPMIWNSIPEWHAYIPYIQFDLPKRPMPLHFNPDQVWMSQWFETSTLILTQDTIGCWILVPQDVPTFLILNACGTLIPIFMNLECGMMYANGQQFTAFAQTALQIQQMWCREGGNYHRIY